MTNKTNNYQFTIIVPVYNEVDNMDNLRIRLGNYLKICPVKACVLFVNDGSTDGSGASIGYLCDIEPDFYYISFKENRGLSAAIKAGIDVACSRWVGYIDADLQTNPNDFNKLLPYAEAYPLVTGIRANRKDTWFKRRQSKIANNFRRMMTGDTATDTGCPLKVIRTDFAKRIPFFKGMHRFLPALIMLQQGGSFKELPVEHSPRVTGVSKFHLSNRLVGPFVDCFAYRWMKKRYINYEIGENNIE